MPSLVVRNGPDAGRALNFAESVVIGRSGLADLEIDDASVSRRHAQVMKEAPRDPWQVRDLGSANGTFLNGRRITGAMALADGDELRLGSVLLEFASRIVGSRSDTTVAHRSIDADSGLSQVLERVDAQRAERDARAGGAGNPWLLLGDSLTRIGSMLFDERAVLTFAVEELVKLLPHAERAFMMLWDDDLQRFVPSAAKTRAGSVDTVVASHTLLREVLTRKEAVLLANVDSQEKYAASKSMLGLQMRTAICAPIVFQQQMLGVLQADSTSMSRPFTRGDLGLVLALASQVAMAIAYARLHTKLIEQELFDRDLALARKIQHHFLPRELPDVAGFTFAVEYRPALAVGGDLYDFIKLGSNRLLVTTGDVSGKGVAAALFAAKVNSDIRHHATEHIDAVSLLTTLNQELADRDREGMFVTLALAIIDLETHRLTVASAGHPLPIGRDPSGRVLLLGEEGDRPLGLDAKATFRERSYELDRGDTVLLFSDGVTEALSATQEQYGATRLAAAVAAATGPDSGQLVRAIVADVEDFASGQEQSDDITVVSFQRH